MARVNAGCRPFGDRRGGSIGLDLATFGKLTALKPQNRIRSPQTAAAPDRRQVIAIGAIA
jgi:hypothetical protein